MRTSVLKKLINNKKEKIHLTLIDPDKTSVEDAKNIAINAAKAGSTALLIGGSLGIYEPHLSRLVKKTKESGLPVILFPGNINGLTSNADAVLFMLLLNSDDPYYVGGVQAQAAPIILRMGLEVIPTTYIIIGHGGAAGYIGKARPIPYERGDIAAAYALAGAMLGTKVIYLEAGSGAPSPIPSSTISLVRKALDQAEYDGILLVGGGITEPEVARDLIKAGADGIVNGTIVEKDPLSLYKMVRSIKTVKSTRMP
ncbi:MAG: geranylgeranylglyceryl/heptaprenylglyceryl phosphate synthase [Caldisphaeraceae archaeon]|nr:geranylgeranylglyceryl/heptaprenylglyceryl phosphate synthase [Caldisphaeraceae archaeon]